MTYKEKCYEKTIRYLERLPIQDAIENYQMIGEWLYKKINETRAKAHEDANQQLQKLNFKSDVSE